MGAWCWRSNLLPYFRDQGYESYALDFRGRGKLNNTLLLNAPGLNDFVAELARFIETLSAPPIIIAHSMGGLISMKYLSGAGPANLKPRAKGLAMMSAIPPDGVYNSALKLLFEHPLKLTKYTGMVLYPFLRFFASPPAGLFSDRVDDRVKRNCIHRLHGESPYALFDIVRQKLDIERIKKTPLLVMGAAGDELIFPEDVERTARTLGVEPIIFPYMGHLLMLEPDWGMIARQIENWIAKNL